MAWILNRAGVWLRVAAFCGAAWTVTALGQTVVAQPPQSVEDALHEMSDASGVIFAGQVTSVVAVPDGKGGTGSFVQVVFRVDQAVRGCVTGGSYGLKEWAGLWANGEPRYRVGQQLVMLLRSPGVSGLSSPVGGMDGAIPIRGGESEITNPGVSAADIAKAVPPVQMVDLRWIAARVLRGAPVATSGLGAGSVAAQAASVDTVIGMLTSWELARIAN